MASREAEPPVTSRLTTAPLWVSACGHLLLAVALVGAGLGSQGCSGEETGCSVDAECPAGGACREGTCVQLCSDESDCTLRDQSCVDGVCSTQQDSECADEAAVTCSDDNLCTEADRCTANGACVGDPVSCDDPPESECVEADTIFRTYDPVGTCSPDTGDCAYTPNDTACADCANQCATSCTPNCTGRQCGDDDCGGSCGTCSASDCLVCSAGSCVSECNGVEICAGGSCCTPGCPACRTSAVSDGCGGSCAANCSSPSVCDGDSCCAPSCPACLESSVADGCGDTCAANCTGSDQCCGDTCTPPPTSCTSGWTDCDFDWCNGCEWLYDDDPSCPSESVTSLCADQDTDVRYAAGFGEAWILVPAIECNNSGVGPVVSFSLFVDACADFDFYVYQDSCTGDELVNCAGSETIERKCVGWSDFPAVDNSRDLYVEVRAFSETATCCGYWDLVIEGNVCWTATAGCTPD